MKSDNIRKFCRVISVIDDIFAGGIAICAALFFIISGMTEIFLLIPTETWVVAGLLIAFFGEMFLIGIMALCLHGAAILWDPRQKNDTEYNLFIILFVVILIFIVLMAVFFGAVVHVPLILNIIFCFLLITFFSLNIIAFCVKKKEKRKRERRRIGIQGIKGEYAGIVFDFTPGEKISIGKSSGSCQIVLTTRYVSKVHCTIRFSRSKGLYELTDCSTNGTFIEGGVRLPRGERCMLRHGDRFEIVGGQKFRCL